MPPRLRARDGALTVPMLLAMTIVVAAGFGVWGMMRQWRKLVELQLRLDECVGSMAVDLRGTLSDIETENEAMAALRLSWPLLASDPARLTALRVALRVILVKQEVDRARWEAKRLLWLAQRGCQESGDFGLPIAALPWRRKPEDFIGPQPLEWTGGLGHAFHIQLNHPPRYAAARVQTAAKSRGGLAIVSLNPLEWHLQWEAAFAAFRPNLR